MEDIPAQERLNVDCGKQANEMITMSGYLRDG